MRDPNNAHHTYNTGYAYTHNAMSTNSQAGSVVPFALSFVQL